MAYSNRIQMEGFLKASASHCVQFARACSPFLGRKGVSSFLRAGLLFGIIAYLIFKLSSIGWVNIAQSLPSSPFFYILSVIFVFLPILTERIIFPLVSQAKSTPSIKIFIRKHVINKAVMNYAGEGYFVQQLSSLPGLDLRGAAIIVKNLALLRTFSANLWVVVLVLAALIFGNFDAFYKIASVSPLLVIALTAITLGFCLGSVVFFRKLTRLKFGTAGKISALYLLRSILAAGILIAQWNMVLPGTSLAVWGLFLVVFFIAKKSPVGGDLVFVSVALTLPGLGDNSAAIAAMLLTTAATLQVIYSLGFVMTSDFMTRKPVPSAKFDPSKRLRLNVAT